jgi:hypothetical protein
LGCKSRTGCGCWDGIGDFFLSQVILSFFVEHEIVVIFGDEALNFSIFPAVELKKDEDLPQHVGVEGL